MARYSELYLGDELIKLRDGLDVLETHRVIEHGELDAMNIWLYGIVTDAAILDSAKEAISSEYMDDSGEATVSEEDIELAEIAIAIQIEGSATIDSLNRGYPLRKLSFAYQGGEGEGVRTASFSNSHSAYNNPSAETVSVEQMSTQALAVDEGELNAYLQEKGKGSAMQVRRKVQRNEEATVNAPHVPEPPKPKSPQGETPGIQKAVASLGGNISSIVENFLG